MATKCTIHKTEIKIVDRQVVALPIGAQILHVAYQGLKLYVWYKFIYNEENGITKGERLINIYGTGHPISTMLKMELHLATVFDPMGLMWHVFEQVPL